MLAETVAIIYSALYFPNPNELTSQRLIWSEAKLNRGNYHTNDRIQFIPKRKYAIDMIFENKCQKTPKRQPRTDHPAKPATLDTQI